jgi:hypothetical protein
MILRPRRQLMLLPWKHESGPQEQGHIIYLCSFNFDSVNLTDESMILIPKPGNLTLSKQIPNMVFWLQLYKFCNADVTHAQTMTKECTKIVQTFRIGLLSVKSCMTSKCQLQPLTTKVWMLSSQLTWNNQSKHKLRYCLGNLRIFIRV